uniref:Prefoldin subunit 1 n=1 Tax=Strigamia maritima TaxID=126957 RepID=T1IU19_STRMM
MAVPGLHIPVDMELKRAFQELQTKTIESTQKIKIADIQVEGLRRSIQHSKLTDQEISTLPADVRTYEGVGRMFILTPTPDVRLNLEKKIKNADEKIKTLENNKSYLERSLKESEDNIREMVFAKQAK